MPFIIKSPKLSTGVVSSEVSLLDVAPTVLDLAGLSPDPQFEGVSLVTGSSPVEIFHENGKATVIGATKTIDYDQGCSN